MERNVSGTRNVVRGTLQRTPGDDTAVESEPDDPDEANPAYSLGVTLSPKTFDRRDGRPGDDTSALWGDDPQKYTLTMRENISRQKRHCFFESHEHIKHEKDTFYAKLKNEIFSSWPDDDDNNKTFYRIVMKDTLRKFMVAFCRRWPDEGGDPDKDIGAQYQRLLMLLDGLLEKKVHDDLIGRHIFDAILCRDYIKADVVSNLKDSLHHINMNQRWQVLYCFLDTCAFVKQHDEAPVFCVEAAGRDDFVVTTYGFAPQQHALFPGVPLQLQSATGLQYTLVLHPCPPTRRLVMLDASLPGDGEE